MDERILFERLHNALDMAPRPDAYERLRVALAKSPARPERWPALRMRGSNMGLRLAAGLAFLVLAAALVAAFLAAHNATTGSVPAGTGLSIQAYQKLTGEDGIAANNTWSSPCDTTQHSGCQADASRALVALQHWLGDLNRSQPPARFAVVDAQLRLHITGSIAGLNALLAASQAGDQAGMDRAYLLALAGRTWTDAVIPGIVASHQVDAAGYTNEVRAQSSSLAGCASCQQFAGQGQIDCPQSQSCQDLVDATASQISGFQSTLATYAAPSSLTARDSSLQQDLARADTALIGMDAALSTGDQASFTARRAVLQQALAAVNRDAAAAAAG
jgi:hypothetical protein